MSGTLRQLPTAARLSYLSILALYGAVAVFAEYLIWAQLNVLQIDASGHIASARVLREGGFHGFVDTAFLGYVQNLFYPPLEDALIAA